MGRCGHVGCRTSGWRCRHGGLAFPVPGHWACVFQEGGFGEKSPRQWQGTDQLGENSKPVVALCSPWATGGVGGPGGHSQSPAPPSLQPSDGTTVSLVRVEAGDPSICTTLGALVAAARPRCDDYCASKINVDLIFQAFKKLNLQVGR